MYQDFPEYLHPEDFLSWHNVFGWQGLLALSLGLLLALTVVHRPKWFWPLLLMGTIVGIGPRVKGYFILDELVAGFLVLGALARIVLVGSRSSKRSGAGLDRVVFLLWTAYMTWEAVRGTVVNQDSRLVRWIAFYSVVALISWIIYHRKDEFPFPSFRQVSLLILGTTVVYYALYIGQGVYGDLTLTGVGMWGEAGRFRTQNYIWSGSALAVFPTLIAMPAAMSLVHDRSRAVRWLVWFAVLQMIVVGFYFDSRISWFVVFPNLVLSARKFKIKHLVAGVAVFGLAYLGLQGIKIAPSSLGEFGTTLGETWQVLWAPASSDVGRQLDFDASFLAVTDNPSRFLVGEGIGSGRFVIKPYIYKLFEERLPWPTYKVVPGSSNDQFAREYRGTAYSELILDSGFIGMSLLALTFALLAHQLLIWKSSNRLILLFTVGLAALWMVVNNIRDLMLLYLLIMPFGLAYQLSRAAPAEPLRPPPPPTGPTVLSGDRNP